MGQRITDEASLASVGWGLQKRLDAECVLITRGPEGMSLFEKSGRTTHLPTAAREVFDVTGAGDTVVGVVALALSAEAAFPSACVLPSTLVVIWIHRFGSAQPPDQSTP